MVVGKLATRTGEGLLNLKDLLTVLPPSGAATFSGFFGRLKRGDAYLLIRQQLLAKSLRRVKERLRNLKDLLTVFPPSLRRLFENEPVLRRLSCAESRQIPSFSCENVQIIA